MLAPGHGGGRTSGPEVQLLIRSFGVLTSVRNKDMGPLGVRGGGEEWCESGAGGNQLGYKSLF